MQVQLLSQSDKDSSLINKREQYDMWMEASYQKGEMLAEHFSIAFSISLDFYSYDALKKEVDCIL